MKNTSSAGERMRSCVAISIGLFFLFLAFSAFSRSASAQDIPVNDSGNMPTEEVSGTPVSQMIDALQSGGIVSPKKNAASLISVPNESDSAAEVAADSPQPSPDPNLVATLDSGLLQNLESNGGIVTGARAAENSDSQTIFSVAARFLARVVFRNETEFLKRPKFDDGVDIAGTPTFDQDTAGYAVIKKENQSVQIDFDSAYDNPPVVTATLSLQQYKDKDVQAAAADLLLISDVKYIVSDVTTKGFEIIMDHPADSDIPFSWHALSVRKPKTSKKEGDSLQTDSALSASALPAANAPAAGQSGAKQRGSNLPQAVVQSTDSSNKPANAEGNVSGANTGGGSSSPNSALPTIGNQ